MSRRLVHLVAALGLLAGLAWWPAAHATTYYVRGDGGDATQCTGTTNAAYPGSGQHLACAYKHPFILLPPNGNAEAMQPTLMQPGDTLVIEGGSYMMGYGAPGQTSSGCDSGYAWDCEISNIPSGIDAAHPTVVTGDCSNIPELWGTQRVSSIFNLASVHDVKLACLNLTDHSKCIEFYQPTTNTGGVTACERNTYPFGTWASTGIHAQDVTDLTLDTLDIHGFADYGINAGRLSGTTMVNNVTLRGNGWGGWSGDLGGNNHTSTDSGTLNFTGLDVEWNGCAENYPDDATIVGCWGQNEGGYGDGFAEAWTGGNWNFSDSVFSHNTQDGLDMLYANGTGTVTMDRLTAAMNAGNGVKVSGTATLTNSVVNAWCDDWAGYPIAGDGSSGVAGSQCRAQGTAVVMEFVGTNEAATLAYNTITGNGDTLFVGGGSDDGFAPDATDVTVFDNNILLGQVSAIPKNGGAYTAFDWYTDGTYGGLIQYDDNLLWHVRNSACPLAGPGNLCMDPGLANEALDGFDPTPLVSSPAIGNANQAVFDSTHDWTGQPRPATQATLGAVEYQGSSGGGVPQAAFTAATNGLTATFTDASTDAGGTIGAWAWTFGDGGTGTGATASHTYAAAGSYSVTLTVTDAASGKTSSTTQTVTVSAPPPAGGTPDARFAWTADGLTATFTDASTDKGGTLGAWAWTFGDGGTSSGQSPVHTYAAAGSYSVTETVTDAANGKTSSMTQTVTVTAPPPPGGTPEAAFTVRTLGLTATFTDGSSDAGGTLGAWAWTFGDGSTSTTESPVHTYAAAGSYPVTLTVTDAVSGRTSSTTQTVTVKTPPPGCNGHSVAPGCGGTVSPVPWRGPDHPPVPPAHRTVPTSQHVAHPVAWAEARWASLPARRNDLVQAGDAGAAPRLGVHGTVQETARTLFRRVSGNPSGKTGAAGFDVRQSTSATAPTRTLPHGTAQPQASQRTGWRGWLARFWPD